MSFCKNFTCDGHLGQFELQSLISYRRFLENCHPITPVHTQNYERTFKKPHVIIKVLSVHVKETPRYKEIISQLNRARPKRVTNLENRDLLCLYKVNMMAAACEGCAVIQNYTCKTSPC